MASTPCTCSRRSSCSRVRCSSLGSRACACRRRCPRRERRRPWSAPSFGLGGGPAYTRARMRYHMKTLVIGALLVIAAPAWAGSPTDQLREYTDKVIKVLDDPALAGTDRRAAVRKVALEAFDSTETAKRVLARHWQARTPAERDEFIQLFAELLERTYITRINEYGGERIKYVGESIDGDMAIVRARILTKNGTEVPVESRMLRHGDRWLIYDVVIENVSLIANYRSQFDRIVRTSSYEELVRRLKSKPAP
ncbi:MAG: organic solvent tolerance ABC transporter substrate-binding protein [Candidatus Rokuibacteriota bacterium]|nr:MAG: organic solvent tolerance ABC transporter substrate-binding protein [Candidatus Rokubacteria bacterium]